MDSLRAALEKLAVSPADEGAWRYIYRELRPFVLAIVYRRLKDNAAAEDVSQEVLLRVLRARPFQKIREEGAFRAYVWRMALNVTNTYLRTIVRRGKLERYLFEQRTSHAADITGHLSEEDDRLLMEEALLLRNGFELAPQVDRVFLGALM